MIDFSKEKESIRLDFIDNFKRFNILYVIAMIVSIILIKTGFKNFIVYLALALSIWFTLKQIDFIFAMPVYWFIYKNPRYYYTDLYKLINEDFLNLLIIKYIKKIFDISIVLLILSIWIKLYKSKKFMLIILLISLGFLFFEVLSIVRKSIKQANNPDYMNNFRFSSDETWEETNTNQKEHKSNSKDSSNSNKREYNNNKEKTNTNQKQHKSSFKGSSSSSKGEYNYKQNKGNQSQNKEEFSKIDFFNYYKVLGFNNRPESFDDVKLQYRRMVKLHHPDRGGNKEDMQRINEAYSVAKRDWMVE